MTDVTQKAGVRRRWLRWLRLKSLQAFSCRKSSRGRAQDKAQLERDQGVSRLQVQRSLGPEASRLENDGCGPHAFPAEPPPAPLPCLPQETKGSVAVRVALGETQLVQEVRSFLIDNGVSLDSFSQVSPYCTQ